MPTLTPQRQLRSSALLMYAWCSTMSCSRHAPAVYLTPYIGAPEALYRVCCMNMLEQHLSSSHLRSAASVATLLHFLIWHSSGCVLSVGMPSAAGGCGGPLAAPCQALPRCGVASGCCPVSS